MTAFRIIKKIFSQVPEFEVGVRLLYWKVPAIHALLKSFQKKGTTVTSAPQRAEVRGHVSMKSLSAAIRSHGIGDGDILIVHSSMQSLSSTGANPSEIIELLRDIVGKSGTLVMPAIPKYREAPTGTDRIARDLTEEVWTYDVQRTPPWTGALPHKLMKTPGAVRSRFPLNSVVALGKHAEAMLAHELDTPGSTPCGPQSAWAYCANHGAKILMLGVDLAHNLTMIHVAEDCHEDTWPIKNWYRTRKFLIKDAGSTKEVCVRERHPRWAIHYGERRMNADLLSHGVANHSMLAEISLTSLKAQDLLQFLGRRRTSGYPYFLWRLFG